MANITVNQGTQTAVATDTVGAIEYQKVKLDIGAAGASSLFTGTLGAVTNLAGGTVTSVANLVKGTVTRVEGGTLVVSNGTVGAGTVQTYGLVHADYFATCVFSGTSTMGTIKPAVAGSAIYITDMMVSVATASNVEIASGGTSTRIWGTMFFADNGGLVSNFKAPIKTASGSALVYKQSVDQPLTINVVGYVD